VTVSDLAGVVDPLTLDFTSDLDLGRFIESQLPALNVFCAPASTAFPMRRLQYKLDGQANVLQISVAIDARVIGELREVGGLLLIDLVCDWLLDAQGIAVSSSLAGLVGNEGTHVPGGLMRLSLTVVRG